MLSAMAAFSLRTQIAAVFTALVIGTAALFSFLWGERVRHSLEQDISFSMVGLTSILSRILERDLFQFSYDLAVLANSPPLVAENWSSESTRASLERLKATRREFSWVGVADTQGRVRNATDQFDPNTKVQNEAWFRAGLTHSYVGLPYSESEFAHKETQAPSIRRTRHLDISTPVRSGDRTLGVLKVSISRDWIREAIETLRPPNSAHVDFTVAIFDHEGRLIYAQDDLLQMLLDAGQKLPFIPSRVDENYETMQQELPSRVVDWADGHSYLTTVIRMEGRGAASDLGWYIVNRMPVEAAFGEASKAKNQALLMGLIIAALGGIMAWFAAGRISADLRATTAAVKSVEPHQHENSIPVYRSSAEVHVLSSSLHEMLGRLLRVRENMEAIIRQRTSELEAANFALAQQARTDTLTGLLNRRGFEDQSRQVLASTWRNHQPLSIVIFDVDHFKRIIDTLGHEIGDLVLKELAETVRQRLRASDVLARIGGEEFVALLPNTTIAGARTIAESLARAVSEQLQSTYARYTISAGVASALDQQPDMTELLRRADAALYEAKGRGRNRVCIDPASEPKDGT